MSALCRASPEEEKSSSREERKTRRNHFCRSRIHDPSEKIRVIQKARTADRHESGHTEKEADVTDTVHEECLVSSLAVLQILVPETDEEVRAKAHTFPTEERENQGVRKNEHDHAEHEQVDVSKELGKAAILVHVTRRVHRDERRNARDEEKHCTGKPIKEESEVRLEQRSVDPVAESFVNAFCRHIPADECCRNKGKEREDHGDRAHKTFIRTLFTFRRSESDKRKHHHANEREKRN